MNPHELPVYQQRERILEVLKDNQVVVVESPTGSGKTTQLPIILHEAGYSKNGLIGVTQPRRIAAISVSEYIAKQLGTSVPGLVGYKMRFEDKTNDATAIKIMPYRDILAFVPDGLFATFGVTVSSIFFALILGLLAGLGRIAKRKWINLAATVYVEVIRGIPLLVQLFYIYYALGPLLHLKGPTSAIAAMRPRSPRRLSMASVASRS